MRRLRGAVGALVVLALLLVGAPAAQAHADLLSSDPAGGSTLATPPTELRLTYSEAPDPSLSAIELLTSGASPVPTGTPQVVDRTTLVVPITDPLPKGTYTITWRVVSIDDGHVTAGAFAFGVGTPPGAVNASAASTTSGPTPLAVASKAALNAGLMLLVAIAVVAIGLFHDAPAARRRLGVVAGIVALLGAIGFLVSQQRAIGAPLDTYLRSSSARTTIWLVLATTIAAVCAGISMRAVRWAPWAAGIAAAIALGLRAHGGHAAASATPALAETIQWIHMLAGACWAGGLLLLVLLLRERRDDPPVAAARRYSNMAVSAIAIVVASGIIRAVAELGGLGALRDTLQSSYGRTLTIKVAVVLLVIALGAYNRTRSVRRLETDARPLRRVAGVELVAIAGILVLTATLTSFAPPAGIAPASAGAPANTVVITGSDFATTIDVTLSVTPAQPGPNLFRADVTAYGTDQTVGADAVTIRMRSVTRPELPASTLSLRPDGDRWVAQALDPSVEGTYRLSVQVRTGASVTEVPLTLITRSSGTITTAPAPGGDTVAVATFDGGVRLEATSSAASPTQVHVTAFAADGSELPLSDLVIVASPAIGEPERLAVERFTPGHLAATATLAAGTWTLDAVATARDGRTFQCTWPTVVAG
ncbi:MAG: copper resistance CopC/CopD family protein [Actinomycetota bacterium]